MRRPEQRLDVTSPPAGAEPDGEVIAGQLAIDVDASGCRPHQRVKEEESLDQTDEAASEWIAASHVSELVKEHRLERRQHSSRAPSRRAPAGAGEPRRRL